MISRQLLAIIGQRLPAIYDVIPRGPIGGFSPFRFSEAALNPQPLPPVDLGAAIASEFVHTAWLADRFGLDHGIAFKELDEWCPTSGSKFKAPPFFSGPSPDPEPRPEWLRDYHVGFAARLASVSDRLEENSRLRETIDSAIQRSLKVIESAQT